MSDWIISAAALHERCELSWWIISLYTHRHHLGSIFWASINFLDHLLLLLLDQFPWCDYQCLTTWFRDVVTTTNQRRFWILECGNDSIFASWLRRPETTPDLLQIYILWFINFSLVVMHARIEERLVGGLLVTRLGVHLLVFLSSFWGRCRKVLEMMWWIVLEYNGSAAISIYGLCIWWDYLARVFIRAMERDNLIDLTTCSTPRIFLLLWAKDKEVITPRVIILMPLLGQLR